MTFPGIQISTKIFIAKRHLFSDAPEHAVQTHSSGMEQRLDGSDAWRFNHKWMRFSNDGRYNVQEPPTYGRCNHHAVNVWWQGLYITRLYRLCYHKLRIRW